MNLTMAQIARHFIQSSAILAGMPTEVEAGIHAFDPCLAPLTPLAK